MGIKRKIEYILKHNPWILKLFRWTGSLFFRFIGLFVKTDPKLILFTSFSGKSYNDSPRAIYEALLGDPRFESYRCVWAFEQPEAFPDVACKKVKIDTWSYFITTLRAKYWVTSVNVERGLKYKKKGTFYLNTWHGPAINLMGNGVAGRSDFNWDHIDRFCISGEYEYPIIERDFCVKRENMLPSGLPRNDALYHASPAKIAELREKFGIPAEKKVILYAPTWRESTDKGKSCTLRPPIDMQKWKKTLGEDYVVFIRAHVNTREMLGVVFDDVIRNGSECDSVNDLLLISDYLISDYSSIIMDYSILARPIVCFGYDYDEYSKARGGFYFDLDKEIPSGICRTEDDVLAYLLNSDYESESAKAKRFRDTHIEFGGNATEMCVNAIISETIGGNQK